MGVRNIPDPHCHTKREKLFSHFAVDLTGCLFGLFGSFGLFLGDLFLGFRSLTIDALGLELIVGGY
ncbi:MAG: hypothetical protein K2H77_07200, partial [Alistipes sp.]|nr:hypothetical protein [Alistipes sp.]